MSRNMNVLKMMPNILFAFVTATLVCGENFDTNWCHLRIFYYIVHYLRHVMNIAQEVLVLERFLVAPR